MRIHCGNKAAANLCLKKSKVTGTEEFSVTTKEFHAETWSAISVPRTWSHPVAFTCQDIAFFFLSEFVGSVPVFTLL